MAEAFVVAGCPVKNRAWAMERWYEAMTRQSRPVDAFHILFNDCDDDTLPSLLFRARPALHGLCLESFNTGDPGLGRVANNGTPRYSMANLALVRNEWIKRALECLPQATHLWSVDSDVLPDPDVLEKLLAANLPIVAAVVRNSGTAEVYNFFTGRDALGPRRNGLDRALLHMTKPARVSMTGACVLIRRDVLDAGVRYSDHLRGEDVGMCEAARAKRFKAYVHPGARTGHVQEDGTTWR